MAARWESALHSMCPHGLLGPSGDSVEWLAMCTWCRATPRQLRGSPTHINGLHGCACEDTVSCKMSDVSVPRCGAVGATRLGRIPGQHCGRTSKFERRELSVVVFRRVLIYKTAGYGGAVRWCRERDWPFRHSNTIVSMCVCHASLIPRYEWLDRPLTTHVERLTKIRVHESQPHWTARAADG